MILHDRACEYWREEEEEEGGRIPATWILPSVVRTTSVLTRPFAGSS